MNLWNGNLTDNRIVKSGRSRFFLERDLLLFCAIGGGDFGSDIGSYGICTIFSMKICEMFRIYK